MNSKTLLSAPIATLFLCVASASPVRSQSQDAARSKTEPAPQVEMLARSYRLEYTLTETEGAKRIDSRQYTMTTGGGTNSERPWQGRVEIGTRVPVGSKSDPNYQYIDVGTKITGSISMRDGTPVLDTHFDFSSVAPDETNIDGRPILRTLGISDQTPILVGKPMTVGTADDPNSRRTFQLEVTVTEIK